MISFPPTIIEGLFIYQFSILKSIPGVRHGIFTRQGGTSQGRYSSLNLSFSVGDDPQKVRRNRELILKAFPLQHLISLRQVHGKKTVIIQNEPAKVSHLAPESISGDILLTRLPKQGLMIKQADCQSVILYDPEHRAIANIHCGWRGNVGDVIAEAVKKMGINFGSRPSNLIAGIGPSLGPCCAQFINYQKEFPPSFWSYQTHPFYFDLWRLSRDQLIASGILKDRIEIAGLCTSCQTSDFYSYRRERKTGRFATVIALE
jgi:purine-nucleoside/S-methyl-5'-thioadenosine phosphorylase / adenosine deaminase